MVKLRTFYYSANLQEKIMNIATVTTTNNNILPINSNMPSTPTQEEIAKVRLETLENIRDRQNARYKHRKGFRTFLAMLATTAAGIWGVGRTAGRNKIHSLYKKHLPNFEKTNIKDSFISNYTKYQSGHLSTDTKMPFNTTEKGHLILIPVTDGQKVYMAAQAKYGNLRTIVMENIEQEPKRKHQRKKQNKSNINFETQMPYLDKKTGKFKTLTVSPDTQISILGTPISITPKGEISSTASSFRTGIQYLRNLGSSDLKDIQSKVPALPSHSSRGSERGDLNFFETMLGVSMVDWLLFI